MLAWANTNNIVSTNIGGKSTNKVSKEDQNHDKSRASIQERSKEKQLPKEFGNNWPNATLWKDNTSRANKKSDNPSDNPLLHF